MGKKAIILVQYDFPFRDRLEAPKAKKVLFKSTSNKDLGAIIREIFNKKKLDLLDIIVPPLDFNEILEKYGITSKSIRIAPLALFNGRANTTLISNSIRNIQSQQLQQTQQSQQAQQTQQVQQGKIIARGNEVEVSSEATGEDILNFFSRNTETATDIQSFKVNANFNEEKAEKLIGMFKKSIKNRNVEVIEDNSEMAKISKNEIKITFQNIEKHIGNEALLSSLLPYKSFLELLESFMGESNAVILPMMFAIPQGYHEVESENGDTVLRLEPPTLLLDNFIRLELPSDLPSDLPTENKNIISVRLPMEYSTTININKNLYVEEAIKRRYYSYNYDTLMGVPIALIKRIAQATSSTNTFSRSVAIVDIPLVGIYIEEI